jgi:hypothetical protein
MPLTLQRGSRHYRGRAAALCPQVAMVKSARSGRKRVLFERRIGVDDNGRARRLLANTGGRRDDESVELRLQNLREPVYHDPSYLARNVAPVLTRLCFSDGQALVAVATCLANR